MKLPALLVSGMVLAVSAPIAVAIIAAGSSPTPAAAVGGLGVGLKPGTVPAAYASLVAQAGSMCAAAPPSIIAAQIEQESGWNPKAVSSVGAQGISQFLPSTWPMWAQPPTASPFDPAAAIPAQGRYDCAIAAQMQTWQTAGVLPASLSLTQLMLAGYNAGPYAVQAAHGIPNNGQTPDYVTTITARAAHFADATGAVPGAASFAAKEIAAAKSQLGVPYSWAGGTYTGPTLGVCGPDGAQNDCHIVGLDCSGLVMFAVFQASNGLIRLPHFADTQTRTGTPVERSAMQPGDLVSFTNPGETVAHHIGIYLGNNQMINAPESGDVVKIATLSDSYWQGQQWRIARLG